MNNLEKIKKAPKRVQEEAKRGEQFRRGYEMGVKDTIKRIEQGEFQQCDCCGKVKDREFTCGICGDCI